MEDPFEIARNIRLEKRHKHRQPSPDARRRREHTEAYRFIVRQASLVADNLYNYDIQPDTTVEISERTMPKSWLSRFLKTQEGIQQDVWILGAVESFESRPGRFPEISETIVHFPYYLGIDGILFVANSWRTPDAVRVINEDMCYNHSEVPRPHDINVALGRIMANKLPGIE